MEIVQNSLPVANVVGIFLYNNFTDQFFSILPLRRFNQGNPVPVDPDVINYSGKHT